jgi:ketosteroid isomerase-like protein
MISQSKPRILRRQFLPGFFGGAGSPCGGDFLRPFLAIALIFLTFTVTGPVSAATVESEDEREALEMRQKELFAALATKDAGVVAELFAEPAVMHVANFAPIEGRAAIQSFYANLFRFLDSSGMTPSVLEISREGDMAYGFGASTNVFRRGEELTSYEGKYVLVWRKLDDAWKVVLYAVSSNQPDAMR